MWPWQLQVSMWRTRSPGRVHRDTLWCKSRGGKLENEQQAWRKHHLLFPLLAWIDLAKNKTSRTPLSDRVAFTDDHTGQVSHQTRLALSSPAFIYVEIELLSAKPWSLSFTLWSERLFLPTDTRRPKQYYTYRRIRLQPRWHKHWHNKRLYNV